MNQDRFSDDVIFRAVSQVPLFTLRYDQAISATLAGFLIYCDENISACRHASGKVDRPQIADDSRWYPIEYLQRATCRSRLNFIRFHSGDQHEIRMQRGDMGFRLLLTAASKE